LSLDILACSYYYYFARRKLSRHSGAARISQKEVLTLEAEPPAAGGWGFGS